MRQAAGRGIGEAIQHHRQATGGRPRITRSCPPDRNPHLRRDIQPVRRVRLIMGYRRRTTATLAPLRQRQIGHSPPPRQGRCRQDAIVAAAGVVLAIPNSPTPKAFTPSAASWRVRCMLASSTVSACWRLMAAVRAIFPRATLRLIRPGSGSASCRHPPPAPARPAPPARRRRCCPHHIAGMNGRHHLRRRGHLHARRHGRRT